MATIDTLFTPISLQGENTFAINYPTAEQTFQVFLPADTNYQITVPPESKFVMVMSQLGADIYTSPDPIVAPSVGTPLLNLRQQLNAGMRFIGDQTFTTFNISSIGNNTVVTVVFYK